jgi:hypothetical protein
MDQIVASDARLGACSRCCDDAGSRRGNSSGVAGSNTPAIAIAMRGPVKFASKPHSAVKAAMLALLVIEQRAQRRVGQDGPAFTIKGPWLINDARRTCRSKSG